jgi:hypothetical protein
MCENSAADRRLQIESDDRQHGSNLLRALNQIILCQLLQASRTQQHSIVSQSLCQFRFPDCLACRAARPCNTDDRFPDSLLIRCHFFCCYLQYRLEQTYFRVTYCKLGSMYSNRKSACAGIQVIPGQGALTPFIQLSILVQGKGISRDNRTFLKPS